MKDFIRKILRNIVKIFMNHKFSQLVALSLIVLDSWFSPHSLCSCPFILLINVEATCILNLQHKPKLNYILSTHFWAHSGVYMNMWTTCKWREKGALYNDQSFIPHRQCLVQELTKGSCTWISLNKCSYQQCKVPNEDEDGSPHASM